MTLHVIAQLYIALPELGIVSLNVPPPALKGGPGGGGGGGGRGVMKSLVPSAPLFLCHRLYKARMRLFVSTYHHENTMWVGLVQQATLL